MAFKPQELLDIHQNNKTWRVLSSSEKIVEDPGRSLSHQGHSTSTSCQSVAVTHRYTTSGSALRQQMLSM